MSYPSRIKMGLSLELSNGWPRISFPQITLQPQSQTVDEYGTATFTVAATGTAPLTYTWRKNGTIVGTNSASYSLITAATDNAAVITCTVSNAAGSVVSSNAVLSVMRNVVTFNGTTQSAQAPNISLVNNSDFRFECTFIRNEAAAGGQFVFAAYSGGNYGVNIYTSGSWGSGGGSISLFGTSLQSLSNKLAGVEYKVVIQSIGNSMTLLVNGVLESTTTDSPAALYASNPIYIADRGGSFRFNGKVKSLKVFNPINTLVRDYRMNDGFANNPVCVNSGTTGASGNGTYIDLTSGSWSREVAS